MAVGASQINILLTGDHCSPKTTVIKSLLTTAKPNIIGGIMIDIVFNVFKYMSKELFLSFCKRLKIGYSDLVNTKVMF